MISLEIKTLWHPGYQSVESSCLSLKSYLPTLALSRSGSRIREDDSRLSRPIYQHSVSIVSSLYYRKGRLSIGIYETYGM